MQKHFEIKSTRRILDAAGAMVLLEITYLLAFCPAAEAAALRGGGAGRYPNQNRAASHRVPGERLLARPYGSYFVQTVFCFHGSFPPKCLNVYKAHYCAPTIEFVNTSMTATANSATAIQLASGARMYNSRQLIRTTQARRSRARGRMAVISLDVKWSEALFAGASTKMHRTEANKTVVSSSLSSGNTAARNHRHNRE